MITILLTILLTLLFLLVFVLVIYLSGRSGKRFSRLDVLSLINNRLDDKNSEASWISYINVPIQYDTVLEQVRQECLQIERAEQLLQADSMMIGSPLSKESRQQLVMLRNLLERSFELKC